MKALFRRDPLGVAALVLAICALGAAALMAGREIEPPVQTSATRPADPLTTRLRACRTQGVQSAEDPACHAAWAESRRRFLGGAEAQP